MAYFLSTCPTTVHTSARPFNICQFSYQSCKHRLERIVETSTITTFELVARTSILADSQIRWSVPPIASLLLVAESVKQKEAAGRHGIALWGRGETVKR